MAKIAVLVLLASVAIALIYLRLRLRTARPAAVRTGLRRRMLRPPAGRRRATVQSVCSAAAAQMQGVVLLLQQTRSSVRTVACAPWGGQLGPLDTLAACAVFKDGMPAGTGSGRHAMSDWLFVPIAAEGKVLAVAAIAGRHCRRSFDPVADPVIAALTDSLRTVMTEPALAEETNLSAKVRSPTTRPARA